MWHDNSLRDTGGEMAGHADAPSLLAELFVGEVFNDLLQNVVDSLDIEHMCMLYQTCKACKAGLSSMREPFNHKLAGVVQVMGNENTCESFVRVFRYSLLSQTSPGESKKESERMEVYRFAQFMQYIYKNDLHYTTWEAMVMYCDRWKTDLLETGGEEDGNATGWIREAATRSNLFMNKRFCGDDVNTECSAAFGRLHLAAAVGNVQNMARVLMAEGEGEARAGNELQLDACGRCPLFTSLSAGHLRVSQLLLLGDNVSTGHVNFAGQRLEHAAAIGGNPDCVRALFAIQGAANSMRHRDNFYNTPISLAAALGNIDALRVMLREHPDKDGVRAALLDTHMPPGMCAVRNGQYTSLRLIIEASAAFPVNVLDFRSRAPSATMLHEAVRNDDSNSAKLLIASGAGMLVRDGFRMTPLHRAVVHASVKCIKVLVESGSSMRVYPPTMASIDKRDTVVHVAAKLGRMRSLEALLQLGCVNVNILNKNGETPLHYAALMGKSACVTKLMDFGADATIVSSVGAMPNALLVACESGNGRCVTAMVEHELGGVDLLRKSVTRKRMTPLHLALPFLQRFEESSGVDMLHSVLNFGIVDVNQGDEEGDTPLHVCAMHMNPYNLCMKEAVEILLAASADMEKRNSGGRTPLMCAAARGNVMVARLLLAAGADVSARVPCTQMTAPLLAINNATSVDILVPFLKECKIDPGEHRDSRGCGMLHFAAWHGSSVEVIDTIVNAGICIDMVDDVNRTALHSACRRNHVEIVERLLELGASPDIRDKCGKDPYSYATHANVVQKFELYS